MNIGFRREVRGDLVYYTIPAFEKTGLVRHCFTTRKGGVSTGETYSLNLGFNRKDTRENVLKNYDIICSAIGVDSSKLVFSNQVHEDVVRVITSADCGKGISRKSDIIGVDGLVCAEAGVPFITFYADCVPLFFLDPKTKTSALTHSGWKSTVKQISIKTVKTMIQNFGCLPQDILVGIGPSIGKCHFEVDGDVAELFDNKFVEQKGEKYFVDLWNVIISQLKSVGIADENITLANICTYCNNDEFYSHRADHGKIGSLAAIMELI